MPTDHELLRDYARHSSESAFTELVRRHVNMVYSAALRETHGDATLAEDITQTVFTELALKASQLCRHPALAGWLYTCVRHKTANARRADERRQQREMEAHTMKELLAPGTPEREWRQLQPVLDDAMHELSEADRAVVVLRFFEDRSHTEVGLALGLTETAARKRVDRALEKLRGLLTKRGITSTASGLTAALAFGAVTLAPANLVATVAAGVAVATASTAATSFTLFNLVTMTKLQIGIIGALVVAGVATPLVMQHQAQVELREQNDALRQQVDQLTPLIAENERLSNLVAQASGADLRSTISSDELLRLRAEVTRLRANVQVADRGTQAEASNPMETGAKELLARVDELKRQLDQMPTLRIPEIQFLTPQDWFEVALRTGYSNPIDVRSRLNSLRKKAKDNFAVMLSDALRGYVQANGGRLPPALSSLKPYFESPVDDAVLMRYQLLHTGDLGQLTPETLLVEEKSIVDDLFDSLYAIGLNQYKVRSIIGSGIRGGGAGEYSIGIIPRSSRPK